MDESSPYAVAYKYMHEVQQEEQGSACAENRTFISNGVLIREGTMSQFMMR